MDVWLDVVMVDEDVGWRRRCGVVESWWWRAWMRCCCWWMEADEGDGVRVVHRESGVAANGEVELEFLKKKSVVMILVNRTVVSFEEYEKLHTL